MNPHRVLVVGGTGGFGQHLIDGLLVTTKLDIVIGARNQTRTEALAARLRTEHPGRVIEAAALDVATVTADCLRRLKVWCVADMTGPFQNAAPRLATTAVAAGCHYVDIADARDFVANITQLDSAAKAANVLVASGASSTPALSHAVLDELVHDWQRIDRIEVVIAPGNRQPRGLALVQAILARAGQPARVFRKGGWTTAMGWGLLTRKRLPGLGRRWLSVAETPDLDLVPARFGPRRDGVFYASLELPVMHLGLWAVSGLVKLGLLKSLVPLARPLQWVAQLLYPFGTDRGGMTVMADGIDADGHATIASWVLVATKGDGPNIPVLPALAAIKALDAGTLVARGAMPCVGLLPLAALQNEFARFRIVTRLFGQPRQVFARALGQHFEVLPKAIQQAHEVDGTLRLKGRASVEGAANPFGWLAARVLGFPRAAQDIPVEVTMAEDRGGEIWVRQFGGGKFQSRLSHTGRRTGSVEERFGLVTFRLALTATADGIDMTIVAGRIGCVPLPVWLLPHSMARERVDAQGRFTFDVPIGLPGLGRLVHYRGWLVPDTSKELDPSS